MISPSVERISSAMITFGPPFRFASRRTAIAPSMLLWSLTAAKLMPRSMARRTYRSGVVRPSREKWVWLCRSARINAMRPTSVFVFVLGRGGAGAERFAERGDAQLGAVQQLAATLGQAHPLFEQRDRLVQRQAARFELAHRLFELHVDRL